MKELRAGGDPCFSAVHERARLGAEANSFVARRLLTGQLNRAGWARTISVFSFSVPEAFIIIFYRNKTICLPVIEVASCTRATANMFTKCCGCNKKVSKHTKSSDTETRTSVSTIKQPSLRKSDTNTDLNHTDTDSKDNASTKPVTPVLFSPDGCETMPEIVSTLTGKNASDSSRDPSSEEKLQDCDMNKKSEIPMRVEETEIMVEEACDTNSDSDDVFREGVGPAVPLAANLATPYPSKKGPIPGLPRWFSEDDDEQERGGTQEPPATPVGKDELALRRHRFFSELMTAAQAAAEHRVSFDPLGPVVADDENLCNHQALFADLEALVVRLECVATRLENSTGVNILAEVSKDSIVINIEATPSVSVSTPTNMSLEGFQDILNGPVIQYLTISKQIGGDVAAHSELVHKAFQAQLQYLIFATQSKQPSQSEQMQLLQPTSEQISAIQSFREKNRTSTYFNHLSAISESIPALGWVTVSPTPAPYVKEMNDAGQFYTNRVLKDWKEKDKKHVEWVKSWVQTLSELQKFVKQYHTTGLVWSGKGCVPPPPPGCPPPPPVMMADLPPFVDDGSQDRSALFAQINQGENITKNLKKVTSEMQTHKNTTLRTGPAPFKAPSNQITGVASSMPVDKPPSFCRDGKKWLVEYQKGNKNLVIEEVEMNNVVYMFKCVDSNLVVKGKLNSVIMDSCKKSCVVFDSLVSSVEFINCQSVQMQVLGKVPTISVDKTDGCQMYLSPDSLEVEIISSKSSEMNVMVPKGNGDYTEYPVPEQYKTTVVPGKGLSTMIVENKG